MVYVLVHGNHCWTFRWFFSLLFQIYRVHVVDSAHHLLNIKWEIRPFCFRSDVSLLSNICSILSAFGLPSIICRRHHADDILAKKMKKNPPSPSLHQIPLYPLLYCSEVWWRNYLRLNPLNLGPSNFWFLCVPLLQLPAFHPNNCLQQTPRTIYYDTFLEWSVLCFFFLFSVLKQNGSCVTFLLECLQHIIVNTYSKWRWCSSTTQYTRDRKSVV